MASNLNFNPQNGLYVATKTVQSNFAVHVECPIGSTIKIYQSSDADAPNKEEMDCVNFKKVIDRQYMGIVMPVVITITSSIEPSYGSIIEAD